MKIVIDLGCKGYGGPDDSIDVLVERYHPNLLLGFDPQVEAAVYTTQGQYPTTVMLSAAAAWRHNGVVSLSGAGQTAGVRGESQTCLHARGVPCFDMAALLHTLPHEAEIIVKMDIEGAEYPLLQYLWDECVLGYADQWLVEWHTNEYARGHDTSRGRAWYESRLPHFDVWHDPMHARCCNGEVPCPF